MVIQVILEAVIDEHALLDDATLAERVNRILSEVQAAEAGQDFGELSRGVTLSMVETVRLPWSIKCPAIVQRLQAMPASAPVTETARLEWTRVATAEGWAGHCKVPCACTSDMWMALRSCDS